MEKEIAEFFKGDFTPRFIAHLEASSQLKKCVTVDQDFIHLVLDPVPPLETLLVGASGKIEEKVFYDGFLGYRIIDLVGTGKLPVAVLDCMVDSLARPYDTLKKVLPAINIEENEEN